jgi:hypothetical protein
VRLVLAFGVLSISMAVVAAANALNLRLAQLTNTTLTAIELSSRQQE